MRNVKVSVLSAFPYTKQAHWTYQQMVDEMITHLSQLLQEVLVEKPDLIVFPEVCDRYEDMSVQDNRAYYDVRKNQVRDFLQDVAKKHHCYIAYSAYRQIEDGTFRNSTQLIGRKGTVEGIYNKNNLVVREGVLKGALPMYCGKDAPVFDLDFGKVSCAICFDLNFNELRQRYIVNPPEIMLFSSMYHGDFLQQAWAYDIKCYFLGAVAGQDARVISPVGHVIKQSTNYYHHVTTTINLDYAVCYLDENWEKFRKAKEKYGDQIQIFDPGKTGAILLTSNSPNFTIQEVLKEFEIECMTDYFNRNRKDKESRTEHV